EWIIETLSERNKWLPWALFLRPTLRFDPTGKRVVKYFSPARRVSLRGSYSYAEGKTLEECIKIYLDEHPKLLPFVGSAYRFRNLITGEVIPTEALGL
ncbi:MAG: hypothetical protein MN733_08905, partial [Nitrososphaera sp.]|nr:hypothetical protein [Nitrososphaera sp.]